MNKIQGHNLQFGYFLNMELWNTALKILDAQIITKQIPNRHFNNIATIYYEKVHNDANLLNKKEYFDEKVANNFFYGLEKEFFVHLFTVPKAGFGLRRYVFFSYPMQTIYNAVGLYILKVTQLFIESCKQDINIKYSYYGGHLWFSENGKLSLKYDKIYFKPHYDTFKREVKKELKEVPDKKILIKLDIQNYFDCISIEKLLNLISHYVKPSELKIHNFDESTKELINFFFIFINNGEIGIPQSHANILSSFIGYLYLLFGDLIILDLIDKLNSQNSIVEDYRLVRYVDDTYISITFADNINKENKLYFIFELLKNIAEQYYSKLNLRFNNKLEIYQLDIPEERDKLLRGLKRTSINETFDVDKTETPIEKLESIFDALTLIKTKELSFLLKDKEQEAIIESLNEIFDERVEALLSKPESSRKLEKLFENFRYDLFRVHPKVLIILLTRTVDAKKEFIKYLLKKKPLTSFDVDLIVNFLCQNSFDEEELLEKLKDNKTFSPIIKMVSKPEMIPTKDYFKFNFYDIKDFRKDINITEQIRLRVYHEKLEDYSIALNHLLNEFHAICRMYDIDYKDKNYNEKNVSKFLGKVKVNSEARTKIRNLFDRRNKNPISHPGSDEVVAWAVTKDEYFDYKKYVRKCLKFIIAKVQKEKKIKNTMISNLISSLIEKKANEV